MSLVAGQRYYIEVIHKEGTSAEHCLIAWQKEGDATPELVPASAMTAFEE
jgi:hypothetical protein